MRFLRDNPLLLLGVVIIGFGTWVIGEQLASRDEPQPQGQLMSPPLVRAVDLPTISTGLETTTASEPPRVPGVVTSDLVPQLRPGMSRSEVEAIIGPPPADLVTPVAESNGRMTYHAAYLANLDARPPLRTDMTNRRAIPPQPPIAKSVITLEFDATRPGHPLVRVHYADPLF